MDKLAAANRNALIKLASTVYDMYPHETYALRHNKNNPEYKERYVDAERDYDEPVSLSADYTDSLDQMPEQNGMNLPSRQPYMGQYNMLYDTPNIEGTGHGNPLSRRPSNPQSYN